MQIFFLFVMYSQSNLEESVFRIKNICTQNFGKSFDYAFYLDNSAKADYISKNGLFVFKNQNTIGEFSGWDFLIKMVTDRHKIKDDDIFIFANDTFYTNYGDRFLSMLHPSRMQLKENNDYAVGYVDDFPKPAVLLGIEYVEWIRTNFFIFTGSILKKIKTLCFPLLPEEIFSKNPTIFWSETQSISENFKAYISSWLFGRKNPNFKEYQLKWYKSNEPDSENFEQFKMKAMCILSEHYLSARLKQHHVKIFNLNPLEKKHDRHLRCYYEQQKEIMIIRDENEKK